MGQGDEHQEPGKGRGHKTPANNENKKERTTPKCQPARVVLKSISSASKTTPRITLRTTPKTTPNGSATMRETPPSRTEGTSAIRHTYSYLRSTPASHTTDPSPATRSKATIRESPVRVARDSKIGPRQQVSTKTPLSARSTHERALERKPFSVRRQISTSSEADSELELALRPKIASIHVDAFTEPKIPGLSSRDELESTLQIGDPDFYADGELSGDDLESRMMSFLRRRERSRISRRSEIKSVKWDPAIVACGPLTSITNKPKPSESHAARVIHEKHLEAPAKDPKNSLDNLHQIAADLNKSDRRILQHLLEALKNVDSSDDTTVIRPKKARVPLGEQKVKAKENHPTTTSKSISQVSNRTTLTVKGLNPEAPIYRNFAGVKDRFFPQKENKENIPQGVKWPLEIQRKRPHSREGSKDIGINLDEPSKPSKYIPPALRTRKSSPSLAKQDFEPIWIKTSPPFSAIPSQAEDIQQGGFRSPIEMQESLIDSPLEQIYALQSPLLAQQLQAPLDKQPVLNPQWMTSSQTQQQQFGQPIIPLGFYAPYAGFGIQQNVSTNAAMSPDWYPVPMVPLPTILTQQAQFSIDTQQTNKNLKDRTKRLPVNVIPNEIEAGRTAMALEPAWAKQVLETFTAKYPMTGKTKPLPKLTTEKKIATKIQQRLEVLLLYQKEKKAMKELCGQTWMLGLPRIGSGVSSGSSLTESLDVTLEAL